MLEVCFGGAGEPRRFEMVKVESGVYVLRNKDSVVQLIQGLTEWLGKNLIMSEVDYWKLVEARAGPAEGSPIRDEDWVKANIDSIEYPSEAHLNADDLEISKFQARLEGILDTSNTVDDHTVGDPSLWTNSFTHTLNLTQTIDLN